ncbi:cytochrome c3 family protein [Thermodesulfobacteriota bacterium]
MTPKKELQLAYGMVIILLVVGFLSYTAFSAKTPDQPVRIMFKGVAGKVLFDHKTHTSDTGYGISCKDCHHPHPPDAYEEVPEGQEITYQACGDCHQIPEGDVKVPQSCLECHEPDEVEISKKSDAFHSQCESCHQDAGAGPEENRCSWCHVQ